MDSNTGSDRRKHARSKLRVQLELRVDGGDVTSKGETSDLSIGGFYLETMFTMAVGTALEVTLFLNEPILALASVATCDPLFGNGIRFTKLLPEDEAAISAFLQAHAENEAPKDNGTQTGGESKPS